MNQFVNSWDLLTPFRSLWANRVLIYRLTRREIEARYRGSILGIAWSVLVPLLMLSVYTFIFSMVFAAKWEIPRLSRIQSDQGNFAVVAFTGLIIFNLFADPINRAPSLMLHHVSYIKRVVFPLEILPWVSVFSALFNALISIAVLLVGYMFVFGVPPLTIFLAPVVLVPLVFITVGISLFLSSIGVFLRDVQSFIGPLTTILMFLTPIFYPISALPEHFRVWLTLLPPTLAVEEVRRLIFFGEIGNLPIFALYFLVSVATLLLGSLWFHKTRKGFADVL